MSHTATAKYVRIAAGVVLAALVAIEVHAVPSESRRMQRAKDYIADEQWTRAVDELTAAAVDPKEPNKDEALFWLAHSQNQAGDPAAAIETVQRLERAFAKSRWVRPAHSLRLEIAQRFRRRDVLWYTATATPAPQPSVPPAHEPSVAAPPVQPAPAPPLVRPTTPPRIVRPGRRSGAAQAPPSPTPRPSVIWVPAQFEPDTDLRIQALGSLIRTDADKVIPILKEIALETDDTQQARRALFVLAQSGRPLALTTVVEVAKTGSEPVRVAAVRELGRLRGAAVANDLLQVYSTGSEPVKHQVVTALGERAEAGALVRIIRGETDRHLRETAVVTLGRAGGREELRALYDKASAPLKRAIIKGLFNARAEAELIDIAERERDSQLRRELHTRLRLLGTPGARVYLERQANAGR